MTIMVLVSRQSIERRPILRGKSTRNLDFPQEVEKKKKKKKKKT